MEATYFGHSCWGLTLGQHRLLIDPSPTSNDQRNALSEYLSESCDFVVFSHAAGSDPTFALDFVKQAQSCTLLAEAAVTRAAHLAGIPQASALVMFWNAERVFGTLHVRAVETRQLAAVNTPAGWLTGMPVAYIMWDEAEPEGRLLHLGDTALFSDLALIGQTYRPVVALLSVGPGSRLPAMTPTEAALACFWLRVDIALPMRFEAQPETANDFCSAIQHLPSEITSWVPPIGETFSFHRDTRVRRA